MIVCMTECVLDCFTLMTDIHALHSDNARMCALVLFPNAGKVPCTYIDANPNSFDYTLLRPLGNVEHAGATEFSS